MSIDEQKTRPVLIANETNKLAATYVNGVAIAVLAVGGLAPMFAQSGSMPSDWRVPVTAILCLCVSGGLHWAARGFLKDLR